MASISTINSLLSLLCKEDSGDCFVLIGLVVSKKVLVESMAIHHKMYIALGKEQTTHLQCVHRPVCVGPVRKQHCWFSHEGAHHLDL